jgi:hypothetical protein
MSLKTEYSREYNSWKAMKQRCNNPNHEYYHRYGGRGIKYAEEFETFDGFLRYMGERPINTTLDRIDPDGHYEPGNVRWASPTQQSTGRLPYKHEKVKGSVRKTTREYEDRAGFKEVYVTYVARLRGKYIGSSKDAAEARKMLEDAIKKESQNEHLG